MDCPVCNERLDFTSSGMGSLVRCQNYHCFHTDCVRDGNAQRASTCPLCPKDTGGRLRALCTTVDQLRALLWQSGIRPRSLGLDFVAPHLVAQAREFVKEKASISRNLSQNSLLELISDQACEVLFWVRSESSTEAVLPERAVPKPQLNCGATCEALEASICRSLFFSLSLFVLPSWSLHLHQREPHQQRSSSIATSHSCSQCLQTYTTSLTTHSGLSERHACQRKSPPTLTLLIGTGR